MPIIIGEYLNGSSVSFVFWRVLQIWWNQIWCYSRNQGMIESWRRWFSKHLSWISAREYELLQKRLYINHIPYLSYQWTYSQIIGIQEIIEATPSNNSSDFIWQIVSTDSPCYPSVHWFVLDWRWFFLFGVLLIPQAHPIQHATYFDFLMNCEYTNQCGKDYKRVSLLLSLWLNDQ